MQMDRWNASAGPRDADVVAAWEKLINEQVDWNDWDVCDSAYVFCDGCVVKEIDAPWSLICSVLDWSMLYILHFPPFLGELSCLRNISISCLNISLRSKYI